MGARSGFADRLVGRFRHGQVTQELLDRLTRIGLWLSPYYLVREQALDRPELDARGDGLEARFLEPEELVEVSRIPQRRQPLARLQRRLEHGKCFGIWVDGTLAAYTWHSSQNIPTARMGCPLCKLPEGTLYLYDAYVKPEYRGHRIAGYMRHKLHHVLKERGAGNFASISLAFNNSSRRFKAKLGAVETELRLLMSANRVGGLDCRLWRYDDFIATPRLKRLLASEDNE